MKVFINCIFAFPIIVAAVNIGVLMFIYPYDTPIMMKQHGQDEKLKEFLTKLYKPEYVQERLAELHN